jgi:heptosyltransferase-2
MKNKKIFIEIPTWLGDAVMATPAIENIVATYLDCELTILGSFVSTKIFAQHPNVKRLIVDDSKKVDFAIKISIKSLKV